MAIFFGASLSHWVISRYVYPPSSVVHASLPGLVASGAVGSIAYLTATLEVVAASVFEELYVRAYLVPRLAEVTRSPHIAILGSALLFALNHIYQGGLAMILHLILGSIAGLYFYKTQRIWPMLIAHSALNVTLLFIGEWYKP